MSRRLAKLGLLTLIASASATTTSQAQPTFQPATAFAAGRRALKDFPPPSATLAVASNRGTAQLNVGVERLPAGAPVTPDTVFQIASLTKPFSAIVILRLVEERRLGLDDRATKWLVWLPAKYKDVTIRQLLAHTSGVPRDLRRDNVDEFSIDEFRRRFLAAEPSFTAGARWEYSNTGYILLSLIAERAGGRNFGELLRRLIFQPVGMTRTQYRAPLASARGRAAGYDWQDGKWISASPVYSGYGNSGIESTGNDVARFALALQNGRLLQPTSYRQMLAPAMLGSGAKVDFPFRDGRSSYGLGWFLTTMCGQRIAAHGGTITGFSSNLSWAIDRKISAITLANGKSGPDRIGIADKVATRMLRASLGCEAE